MIKNVPFLIQSGVLCALLILAGISILPGMGSSLPVNHFVYLVLAVTVINLISGLLLSYGIRKSSREGTVISMAGIGLNFLLYLLCILAFWLPGKNLSKAFIIAFFTLYLIFTFLQAINLSKLLKNK